jgi:hypothetical protein
MVNKIKIKDFLRDFGYNYFVCPYIRIVTLLAYLKQGWNTYDWDYGYLLKDIQFKINRIKRCIARNKILQDKDIQKIEQEIQEVSDLITKIQEQNYYTNWGLQKTNEERHDFYLKCQRKERNDWRQLWRLLDKYTQNWWD